jgi:hypothetical protein
MSIANQKSYEINDGGAPLPQPADSFYYHPLSAEFINVLEAVMGKELTNLKIYPFEELVFSLKELTIKEGRMLFQKMLLMTHQHCQVCTNQHALLKYALAHAMVNIIYDSICAKPECDVNLPTLTGVILDIDHHIRHAVDVLPETLAKTYTEKLLTLYRQAG